MIVALATAYAYVKLYLRVQAYSGELTENPIHEAVWPLSQPQSWELLDLEEDPGQTYTV